MRRHKSLAAVLALACTASPAFAATSTTAEIDPTLKERLKEELRQELVDEIKAEVKSELAAEGATSGGVQEDHWAEEEWKWEEPVKPELNFLEIDGYFRFRYQLFKNLDLSTYSTVDGQGPFAAGNAPPVPLCIVAGSCKEANTLGGANMRLRLEPTLNVSEDIKIKMQIDVFDNLVLGSTPDGLPKADSVPLVGFTQTQLAPSDGVNAVMDSIRVKRVWAEIMTPLGQLRVGRMGSQFGMGILANQGDGIESDYGDSNDRILFATKIANHYIIPAFDWAVSGPTSAFHGQAQGQPFDRDQRDDADQYILAILRRDKDQEIKEKLENDDFVLNYGTYLVYRTQALDSGQFYAGNDPNDGPGTSAQVTRDLHLYIGSAWVKFLYRKLLLEVEAAGILGSVKNSVVSGRIGDTDKPFDIQMWGAAVRGEYKFLHDSLTVRFLVAAASGDEQPGWGVKPLTNTSPQAGAWDGAQQGDGYIKNFRFDPDFKVDLILWRELVGMLTDAVVVRPGVQYNFTEGLGARLDLIYSHAMYSASTPSASFASNGSNDIKNDAGVVTQTRRPAPNLGLEADLRLFYASEDGFHAWLQYGILFPFAGLDRLLVDSAVRGGGKTLSSEIAQTLQLTFGVVF